MNVSENPIEVALNLLSEDVIQKFTDAERSIMQLLLAQGIRGQADITTEALMLGYNLRTGDHDVRKEVSRLTQTYLKDVAESLSISSERFEQLEEIAFELADELPRNYESRH